MISADLYACSEIRAAFGKQAGDDRIQESVARMQRVIELSRVIREGKRKPLKMPLQALVVVHQDQAFLDDISGEALLCPPVPVFSMETNKVFI